MNLGPFMSLILRFTLLAVFVWNVLVFTRALRSAFSRPEGVPPRMRMLAACGFLATMVDAWLLWSGPIRWPGFLAGLMLLAISQWVFRAAVNATARHKLSLAFSGDVPTQLNQSGIYGRVRHPFYLAYTLTWLGAVIGTLHPGSVLALAVMFTFYLTAALHEERKFLASPLAAEYRAYRGRTGMFFPGKSTQTNPSRNP
jgi:protein-S-isoprenylcysteine O-methyltransferase Ste14